MKRIFALLTGFVLMLSLALNVFAFSGEFLIDDADLLTDYEEEQLEDLKDELDANKQVAIQTLAKQVLLPDTQLHDSVNFPCAH